ncbi:MAG: TetR family transcriptional regulator [Jatrophihabitans sp.]
MTGRSPGRPRGQAATDTRQLILAAARRSFAESGFDGASVREIAATAGVDAGLIRHYFTNKAGLLVATMQLPINPLELIGRALAAGPDGMGERLLTVFLTTWDEHCDVFAGLIRTSLASADRSAPALNIARSVILPAITESIGGAEAPLRASLVMSQIIGVATLRYVARLEPIADAPIPDVVAWYAPALQTIITPSAVIEISSST